jgi:hypothetical protein
MTNDQIAKSLAVFLGEALLNPHVVREFDDGDTVEFCGQHWSFLSERNEDGSYSINVFDSGYDCDSGSEEPFFRVVVDPGATMISFESDVDDTEWYDSMLEDELEHFAK